MSVFFINPFLFEAGADFESIATVTVGSGGAANIEFTSIPGTYQHLQVRATFRGSASLYFSNMLTQVNGDTGNNYSHHVIYGDGSTAQAFGQASNNAYSLIYLPGATTTASIFAGAVIDILDYASTSKNKTFRTFAGYDNNGSGSGFQRGFPVVSSGLWQSTSAITSIKFTDLQAGNFVQHSTFALYGIKAP